MPINLFQSLMTCHGHDLVWRRAALGERRRGGLPDTMDGAMRQIGLAAPVLELVPEPVCSERLAKLGEQERQVGADLRRRDARGERRMQRNVVGLAKADSAVAGVLAAKARHILAVADCIA